MTTSAAEQRAMRRALELAATHGVPLGPNPRVGCVLLDDDGRTVAEGFHRGAGNAPRRGRRAGPGRGRAPAARPPSSRSSPATTPAAPGPARRRWSRPAYAGWCSRSATPTRVAAGGAETLRAAGVEVETGLLADEAARAQPRLDLRRRARAALRHLEARHHPRRPQRRRRRHQPVDLGHRGAPRHPPPAGPVRHRARRHQHRRGRRPAADRARRARPAAGHPAAARGDGGARPRRRSPRARRRAPRPSTCAPATRTPRSPSCPPATASTSSSRAAPPWPPRSCAPGCRRDRRLRRADAARRRARRPWRTSASPRSPTPCVPPSPT